jgi:hypothetical protein
MNYEITITTALGRTLTRVVTTRKQVAQTISTTHLVSAVRVVELETKRVWSESQVTACVFGDTLVSA